MKRFIWLLNIVLALSLLVAACAPATPAVVEKEVVVEKPVVETVVIEKEVPVEKEVVEVTKIVEVVATPTPVPPTPTLTVEEFIEETNRMIKEKGYDWEAGITSISHLTPQEMVKLCGEISEDSSASPSSAPTGVTLLAAWGPNTQIPSSFDWRSYRGYDWTTPIRHQRSCGSCVAHAALAVFESLLEIVRDDPGMNPDLSEEFLFFCGCGKCCCNGEKCGWRLRKAAEWLRDTGVPDEDCWPYLPRDTECDEDYYCWDLTERIKKATSFRELTSPEEMKLSLLKNGPLLGRMEVYQDFRDYTGGIYRYVLGPKVGGHAIAIVGYDDDEDYWIGKNSWGTGWGEDGWFRIAYGEVGIDNYACEITYEAEPPTPTPTSLPTPTPVPPTPTPTAVAPVDWPIVLYDSFDDNRNGWLLAPYDSELVTHSREIKNGVYLWKAEAKAGFISNRRPEGVKVGSHFYQAVVAQLVRGPDRASYGIIFRRPNKNNYYIFRINDRQEYAFHVRIDGELEAMLDWEYSSAIQPGEKNKIAVVAEGPQFTFLINDQLVAQAQDTRLEEGEAGVVIGLRNAGDTAEFWFDSFELRAP